MSAVPLDNVTKQLRVRLGPFELVMKDEAIESWALPGGGEATWEQLREIATRHRWKLRLYTRHVRYRQ